MFFSEKVAITAFNVYGNYNHSQISGICRKLFGDDIDKPFARLSEMQESILLP